jgi:hypothetical protein
VASVAELRRDADQLVVDRARPDARWQSLEELTP